MDWHAYKYLAKTVHRIFFPLFAILENTELHCGQKVVAQRKLLFLEKMFGALLIAAPRFRLQLVDRIRSVQSEVDGGDRSDAALIERKKMLLKILKALQALVSFYLPAIFRVGYLVRCCTWEGRAARSSGNVRDVLEEVLLILVHLLQDNEAKNEYVRTLSVTLLTWQPWNSQLPSCCYMEESCEALLSRMGHRCSANRYVSGFEATFDLFLTLPPPSRQLKATRGVLKDELIQTFYGRMRYIINSSGVLPYAATVGTKQMHSEVLGSFPTSVNFPDPLPALYAAEVLERVLQRALLCMSGRGKISLKVEDWMKSNVISRSEDEVLEYRRATEKLKKMVSEGKAKCKPVRMPVRRVLLPKPRARFPPPIVVFSVIFPRNILFLS